MISLTEEPFLAGPRDQQDEEEDDDDSIPMPSTSEDDELDQLQFELIPHIERKVSHFPKSIRLQQRSQSHDVARKVSFGRVDIKMLEHLDEEDEETPRKSSLKSLVVRRTSSGKSNRKKKKKLRSSSSSALLAGTSILQRQLSNLDELDSLKEQEIRAAIYLEYMKKGTEMLKYSSSGSADPRFIKLSADGSVIMWRRRRFGGFFKKLDLGSVIYISFGPRTKAFHNYNWKSGYPWNCFSLISTSRTLDFECKNREQLINWYKGLLYFVPLCHRNLSSAQLNWYIVLYKTVKIAHQVRYPVRHVWNALVFDAKKEIYQDIESKELLITTKDFSHLLEQLQEEGYDELIPEAARCTDGSRDHIANGYEMSSEEFEDDIPEEDDDDDIPEEEDDEYILE